MKNESKELTFHNENVVTRVTLWANIIAFTILAVSLIGFAYDLYSVIGNWAQVVGSLPPNILERIAIFASKLFLNPLVGVFYFLVLRGLAQLFNLGMDLYYRDAYVEEEKTEAA